MTSQKNCKHTLLLEDWHSLINVLVCAYCSKEFDLNQLKSRRNKRSYDNANLVDILTTTEDARELSSRGCFSQSSLDNALARANQLFERTKLFKRRIKYREILVFCIFEQLCKEKNVQNPKTLCKYFQIPISKLWIVHKYIAGFEESRVDIQDFIKQYAVMLKIPFYHIEKMSKLAHQFPQCGSMTVATLAACIIIGYCQLKQEELSSPKISIQLVSEVSTLSESNLRKKISQHQILDIVKARLNNLNNLL